MNPRLKKMFDEIEDCEKAIMKKYINDAACYGDVEFLNFILTRKHISEDTLATSIEMAAHYAKVETLQLLLNSSQYFYFAPTKKHKMLNEWLLKNI